MIVTLGLPFVRTSVDHGTGFSFAAIRRARVLVGPAIILTTLVLTFGLGVTVFSDLPSLRLFGLVCSITLLASLVGDLVFLPANVALWRRVWPVR